jgi:hypothetical protein
MTLPNRINFMDLTASAATFKADAYTFANSVITGSTLTATNYLTLGATSANFSSSAGAYANLTSTNALFSTPGGTTYASLAPGGSQFTVTGQNTFIRTGTANTVQPALTIRYQRTDTTGPNDNDGVDFRLGVGGTVTNTNFARFDGTYRASGLHQVGISLSNDSFALDTDTVYRAQADITTIRATPAGGGTAADMFSVEQTKIRAYAPIQFPTYTVAAAGAITGAVGWQICISNSSTSPTQTADGMMAYWRTDVAGWHYIHDNKAI